MAQRYARRETISTSSGEFYWRLERISDDDDVSIGIVVVVLNVVQSMLFVLGWRVVRV